MKEMSSESPQKKCAQDRLKSLFSFEVVEYEESVSSRNKTKVRVFTFIVNKCIKGVLVALLLGYLEWWGGVDTSWGTLGGDRNFASKSRLDANWPSNRTINGPEPSIHFLCAMFWSIDPPKKIFKKVKTVTRDRFWNYPTWRPESP